MQKFNIGMLGFGTVGTGAFVFAATQPVRAAIQRCDRASLRPDCLLTRIIFEVIQADCVVLVKSDEFPVAQSLIQPDTLMGSCPPDVYTTWPVAF